MDFVYLIIFLIYSFIKDVENVLLKKENINKFTHEKILHVSEEPSLLQCAQRCKFIDKNSIVDFKNAKCTCVKYEVDDGQEQQGTLTGVFVDQHIMKRAEPPKPTKVINVAFQKPAGQSTSFSSSYHASKAVDDNINTRSLTKKFHNSWWRVDLEEIFEIMYILLVRSGYGTKNNGLIAVTQNVEHGRWKICKYIGDLDKEYNNNFTCDNPTKARSVKIKSSKLTQLEFYQIEVYARVPV